MLSSGWAQSAFCIICCYCNWICGTFSSNFCPEANPQANPLRQVQPSRLNGWRKQGTENWRLASCKQLGSDGARDLRQQARERNLSGGTHMLQLPTVHTSFTVRAGGVHISFHYLLTAQSELPWLISLAFDTLEFGHPQSSKVNAPNNGFVVLLKNQFSQHDFWELVRKRELVYGEIY